MKTPCLGCNLRKMNCHSICASYIDFQNESELIRKARGERNTKIGQTIDSVRRSIKTR